MQNNITAIKVFCLPLGTEKQKKLKLMIDEFAAFYNYSAKMQPSLPNKYRDNPKKGQEGLYGKYIKSKISVPRLHLGAQEAYIAVMLAGSNYKTSQQLSDHPSISEMPVDGNILKISGSHYKIIKLNDHFGIQLTFKENHIYIPLKTGNYEKLTKYLENNIEKDVGEITYNLKDNSISIPYKTQSENFKSIKNNEIKTYIGVDLGINNIAVFSAISVDPKEIKKQTTTLYEKGQKDISIKDINAKVLKVKIHKGFENKYKMVQLKNLENKRRKNRIDVGHRRNDLQNRTNHLVSSEIVEFALQFPNPVVIFESNLANLTKGKNSTWSPTEVKSKTEYKLKSKGIWIQEVYPAYTSKLCYKCGAIGIRPKGTVQFSCPSCGLGVGSNPTSTIGGMNADVNASLNIALRGIYLLTRKGKLSEIDAVQLKSPNVPPSDNAREVITPDIREALDGTNSSCKDKACLIKETINRSTSDISEQCDGQTHQVDCVPENVFSSLYKGTNNNTVRTKFEQKIDSGEVRFQS